MRATRTVEISTGLFVLLGFAALFFLVTQITNRELSIDGNSYEVTAMFDPVYQDGALAAGLGSMIVGPIKAERIPLDTSPSAFSALTDQAAAGGDAARAIAAESIGAHLAVAEMNQPTAIPYIQLRVAYSKLLTDRDWRVRARAPAARA